MLSNLSADATDCYLRAAECQERAKLARNKKDREFYMSREQDWLLLAQSYQFSEGMGRAIDDLNRRPGVMETRACPACKTATPIHYFTVFVCTNCHLVIEDQ